jgi:hypothetical protein
MLKKEPSGWRVFGASRQNQNAVAGRAQAESAEFFQMFLLWALASILRIVVV